MDIFHKRKIDCYCDCHDCVYCSCKYQNRGNNTMINKQFIALFIEMLQVIMINLKYYANIIWESMLLNIIFHYNQH